MQTQTLTIEGMSCEMCVAHVTKALESLDGIQSASVSLTEKRAIVTYDPAKVTTAQMTEAIEEEGYEANVH